MNLLEYWLFHWSTCTSSKFTRFCNFHFIWRYRINPLIFFSVVVHCLQLRSGIIVPAIFQWKEIRILEKYSGIRCPIRNRNWWRECPKYAWNDSIKERLGFRYRTRTEIMNNLDDLDDLDGEHENWLL